MTARAEAEAESAIPLTLEVKIDQPSACQRHITVTIPREDIDRYFDKAFDELMPTATCRAFGPAGHRASWSSIAFARMWPSR